MNKFEKIYSDAGDINRLQLNIAKALDPITQLPIISSQIISNVLITAAGVSVSHKLGRDIIGWEIIRKNANQNVWESASQTTPGATINLQSGGNVTVSLLVF